MPVFELFKIMCLSSYGNGKNPNTFLIQCLTFPTSPEDKSWSVPWSVDKRLCLGGKLHLHIYVGLHHC